MKQVIKHTRYIILMMSVAALMTACEIDNYDAPDATLKGTVTDAITGKGLVTEQPGGFQVYYKEIDPKYPNAPARNLWGKADGTFQYTKLFAGKYEVWPANGAFVNPEHQTVTVSAGGEVTANFTVTPYVSITGVSFEKVGADSVTVRFTLQKHASDIQDYRIFASDRTPLVGVNVTENIAGAEVALKESDLGTQIITGRKGFTAGAKYWFRVGARCKGSGGRYNMSEITPVQF